MINLAMWNSNFSLWNISVYGVSKWERMQPWLLITVNKKESHKITIHCQIDHRLCITYRFEQILTLILQQSMGRDLNPDLWDQNRHATIVLRYHCATLLWLHQNIAYTRTGPVFLGNKLHQMLCILLKMIWWLQYRVLWYYLNKMR